MRNRIRIESTENVVTNAMVDYLPEKGVPVDIRRAVVGADISLRVGQPATAKLEMVLVEGILEAEVEEVVLKIVERAGQRKIVFDGAERGRYIRVSEALLPELTSNWSQPLQVKAVEGPRGELELTFREVGSDGW